MGAAVGRCFSRYSGQWFHARVFFFFSLPRGSQPSCPIQVPHLLLVPLSSSQAVVGAVLGIGLLRTRGRGIRRQVLGEIGVG